MGEASTREGDQVRFYRGDLIVANHKYIVTDQHPFGIVLNITGDFYEGVHDEHYQILWSNGKVDRVKIYSLLAYYRVLRGAGE